MDDPKWLLENLVHWYGRQVSQEIYDDYLSTYVELDKPNGLPMIFYRLIFSRTKARLFGKTANEMGISLVTNAQN